MQTELLSQAVQPSQSTAPQPDAQTHSYPASQRIYQARQQFHDFQIETPDPGVHRELAHGWLLPVLLRLDAALWQRWDYWYQCCSGGEALPPTLIPRIEFLGAPHLRTRKMLEASLNCIPNHGSWQTWGNWQYVNYLFDWLLFAFGHPGHQELPQEPSSCMGASDRLYQVVNIGALLLWPYDYWGDILGDNAYGRGQGFYTTPHPICEFMTRMLFDEDKDYRTQTMLDPCVGTGRFPLYASNYSLRLYGMDIDPVLCKAALVNGYLYAPWLVRPIPWLDGDLHRISEMTETDPTPDKASNPSATERPNLSSQNHNGESNHQDEPSAMAAAAHLANRMAEAAPPQAHAYLAHTEHDPQGQAAVAPILKRRQKPLPDPTQGSLF